MRKRIVRRRIQHLFPGGGSDPSRPVIAGIIRVGARPDAHDGNGFQRAEPAGYQFLFDFPELAGINMLEPDRHETPGFRFRPAHTVHCFE